MLTLSLLLSAKARRTICHQPAGGISVGVLAPEPGGRSEVRAPTDGRGASSSWLRRAPRATLRAMSPAESS